MSFLLNALGSQGVQLLGRAGSWLAGKAVPLAQRLGGWIGNTFAGGGENGAKVGQSVMDYFVDKALNTSFDAAHKFANSDFVKKKMPMVAPYIQDGATVFRDRLRDGYGDMVGQRQQSHGPRGHPTGEHAGSMRMEGIEKTSNY